MKNNRTFNVKNEHTLVQNKTSTIITNQETIEAIEEGRKLLGKTKGYKDFEEFWKAVMDE